MSPESIGPIVVLVVGLIGFCVEHPRIPILLAVTAVEANDRALKAWIGWSPWPKTWFEDEPPISVEPACASSPQHLSELAQVLAVEPEVQAPLASPPESSPSPAYPVDRETGEVLDASIRYLERELARTERDRDQLRQALDGALRQQAALSEKYGRSLSDLRSCQERLALAGELPPGALMVRGRAVLVEGWVAIIPEEGGRAIRVKIPSGWEVACSTGDQVLLEARLQTTGWAYWRSTVEAVASELAPLTEEQIASCQPKARAKGSEKPIERLKREAGDGHLRHASHNVTALQFFLTLTRYRRGVAPLTDQQVSDLRRIISEVVASIGWGRIVALEFEGAVRDADHCHLGLIECDPKLSASDAVRRLKAITSKRFRELYPDFGDRLWSSGYFCASAGGGSIDAVKRYIEKGVPKEADASAEAE